jgi:hypothetical protein
LIKIVKKDISANLSVVEYFKDDQYHREDGPAIETASGDKFWYINGKLHREDGPAVEYYSGTKAWYLDDEEIDCQSNEEFLKIVKYKWII